MTSIPKPSYFIRQPPGNCPRSFSSFVHDPSAVTIYAVKQMHSRIDDNNLGNGGSQRALKASRHSAIVFYYFSYERSSLVRAFDCTIGSFFFLSFFTVTGRSVATHLCSFGWWKLLSVLSNGYIAFVVDVATRSSLKVATRYQQPVNEDRPIGVQYRQFSNDWRRCRVALRNPTLP